jgi:hypothetical protein
MPKEIPSPEKKKITVEFSEFLSILIGSFDRASVKQNIAELIAAIDKDENFCHVQFTDFDSTEKLERPIVWWIREWKTCYRKYLIDKERAQKARKEANLLTENTNRLVKAMAAKAGIVEDTDILFRKLALKIAKIQADKAAEQFNVKLDKGE